MYSLRNNIKCFFYVVLNFKQDSNYLIELCKASVINSHSIKLNQLRYEIL